MCVCVKPVSPSPSSILNRGPRPRSTGGCARGAPAARTRRLNGQDKRKVRPGCTHTCAHLFSLSCYTFRYPITHAHAPAMTSTEKLTRFREQFIDSLSIGEAQEFNQALLDLVETKVRRSDAPKHSPDSLLRCTSAHPRSPASPPTSHTAETRPVCERAVGHEGDSVQAALARGACRCSPK